MPNKKVVFFETNEFQKKYLTAKLKNDFDTVFVSDTLNDKNIGLAGEAEYLGVFINSRVDSKVLQKLPKLKSIVTLSTGFDHIDLQECKKRGITVSNVPHYGENTVAEHTLALILAISRKIIPANNRVKEGHFSPKGLVGFDLKGKTLGIVGCGSIGKHVAKMAFGFDMKLLAMDLYEDIEMKQKYGLKYLPLDKLLEQSDIVTFHAPYNKSTHHLLNKSNINKTKKGVVIINTSRGALIETDALYDALVEGQVKAAGLDVLEEEKFLSEEAELLYSDESLVKDLKTVVTNHVLINHPNVLITPHSAFNSKEAIQRILDTTCDNLRGFFQGEEINTVAF
ncbi:hydroxyacid dehydrogenase [bacterium]|nr:hydroxyacid dehydrogenase [bacterium]